MKRSDVLPGIDLNLQRPIPAKEILDTHMEMGINIRAQLQRALTLLAAPRREGSLLRPFIEAYVPQDQPNRTNVVEQAASIRIARIVPAFAAQLYVAGIRHVHELINEDQNANVHLGENLFLGFHEQVMWAEYAFPVVELTHSLTAGLILTEPPERLFTEDYWKLPFPTFAIRIPSGFIPLYVEDKQGWVDLVTVHTYEKSDGGNLFQITVYAGNAMLFRRDPVEELLRPKVDKWLKSFDDDPPMTEQDDATLNMAIRVVANLVAWIDAHGLPAREGSHRKAQARALLPTDPIKPAVFVCGRELKLGKELRQAATEFALGHGPEKHRKAGWKLRMRSVVRGHWKMQIHGAGRSLRKRIWVQPYWRGKEGASVWTHVYKAGEDS